MSQYPWLLLAVYVVTVGGVQLLALWAAASRLPWLLRALVVWAPIALLAIARVYEPALVLLASAALMIGLSFAVQRINLPRDPSTNSRPRLWRFRVADLLVLMLFLATWLGITTSRVPLEYQLSLLLPVTLAATPLALLTLFVHRTVTGPQRLRALLLALGVIWVCALLIRTFNMPLYLGEGQPSLGPNWPRETAYLIGAVGAMLTGVVLCAALPFVVWKATRKWPSGLLRHSVLVAIGVALACGVPLGYLAWEFLPAPKWRTLWQWCLELGIHSVFFFALSPFIALGTWLANAGWGEATGRKRFAARAVAASLVALLALPAAWIYWQMLWYAPFPIKDYGPVNHIDRIMAIAKHLIEYEHSRAPLPGPILAELDEAVALLRAANYWPQHFLEGKYRPEDDELFGNSIMALSRLLHGSAVRAAERGQPDRAADYALAVIRFDAIFDSGGEWGTFNCVAYQTIIEQRREISPEKAREVMQLLHRTLAERDTAEWLVAQHRAVSERQEGWRRKLKSALGYRVFDPSAHTARIREARKPSETLNRLLQAELAIRIYKHEHKRPPPTLDALVHEILSELPIDPYSGKPLIYRPAEKEFVLYSVGPDGEDNGGKILTQPVRSVETVYDIRLE